MELYLLRHTKTRDNELKINGSWTDTPLSLAGERDAVALVNTLQQHHHDLIVVSPLQRTLQTIQPYLDTLSDPFVVTDRRTIERNLGSLTNTVASDDRIERNRKEQGTNKISWTPPNGESIQDVAKRARDFLSWLCVAHPKKSILIVGHQNFLRNLELLLLNRPIDNFYDSSPPRLENGELRRYEHEC